MGLPFSESAAWEAVGRFLQPRPLWLPLGASPVLSAQRQQEGRAVFVPEASAEVASEHQSLWPEGAWGPSTGPRSRSRSCGERQSPGHRGRTALFAPRTVRT